MFYAISCNVLCNVYKIAYLVPRKRCPLPSPRHTLLLHAKLIAYGWHILRHFFIFNTSSKNNYRRHFTYCNSCKIVDSISEYLHYKFVVSNNSGSCDSKPFLDKNLLELLAFLTQFLCFDLPNSSSL